MYSRVNTLYVIIPDTRKKKQEKLLTNYPYWTPSHNQSTQTNFHLRADCCENRHRKNKTTKPTRNYHFNKTINNRQTVVAQKQESNLYCTFFMFIHCRLLFCNTGTLKSCSIFRFQLYQLYIISNGFYYNLSYIAKKVDDFFLWL